ncbi:MAG TPA: lipopolysaccharide assembly protein LapA domain-containing protein [Streptosporangiaceae bacterium]|nr:lipopolysaccharide assembly protein LapA domain-containing protein [Streptosporangiaceae bacterium]
MTVPPGGGQQAAAPEPAAPQQGPAGAAGHAAQPAQPQPAQPQPAQAQPAQAAQPAPPHHKVRRTRAGNAWVVLALFALVLLLLLIFILENSQSVKISFFGAEGSIPLGVALLLAAVLGVLLVVVPGTARILQLRKTAKRHRKQDVQAGTPT